MLNAKRLTMGILNRGERAPDFVLPIMDGSQTRFYSRAGGRPTLLIFTGEEQVLEGLERSEEVDVFVVGPLELAKANVTVFIDGENAVGKAYGLEGDFAAFALDANLRVLLGIEDPNAFDQVYRAFESLPSHRAIDVDVQAPVLLIPNVLTPDICQALINVWATQGNTETGVESSRSGIRRDVIDYENKKRRDHEVTDARLLRLLTSTVGRRVMPEVQRAFHYRATRFEGFKIACYDSESGGFFRAHRDNLSPSTAHRRFALTLNLNDDYTGGHLIFPEFGPHRYRPSAGDAIAFSSSFLHEVQPVTRGRRFTLLSFLFHEGN
ncbi:MAG: 2OG-Fe(II) oxygenase [Gemmatimonadetes bacterium]|nr:2OG-Fe(II) oxygenase [Gemmatimonadota bacterium]